jgi:hypothetical protein
MNTWSPQGSPSSVGSIPIEYDEEEYGYDRDIDYSQFEYLNDMIPAANFTVPKVFVWVLLPVVFIFGV